MPLEQYIEKSFSREAEEIIEQANAIIAEYMEQGYTLTLRQLHYQFVARDIIPNQQKQYKRLGSIISDARLAGRIDWNAIEDRTRNLRSSPSWDSPESIINACAQQFQFDPWADQDTYCEVWIEKDALVGVIQRACEELRVPYFACRGYSSQSEQWAAGKRLKKVRRRLIERVHDRKQPAHRHARVVVFHLGDHDPSGIDMTRDNQDRLEMFAGGALNMVRVEVRRLALNMNQIEEKSPPPNPAKLTDSRANAYVEKFGDDSWELDALEPSYIDGLVRTHVLGLIDKEAWDESMRREEVAKASLASIAGNYSYVIDWLKED